MVLYRTRSKIAPFLKVESAICDRGYYIFFQQLRCRRIAAEVEEDFEGTASLLIKELEAERFVPIKMTRLAEGEYGSKLPTANVHIEWKEAEYFLPHKM